MHLMLRRSTGTIHQGHMLDSIRIEDYYERLAKTLPLMEGYHSGAIALEMTTKNNLHIQFYIEHDRKRTTTLAKDLEVSTEFVFSKVNHARGSWQYCTGTGKYAEKPSIARASFGDPILFGNDTRADLQHLVACIIDGASLTEIMKEYPYAWCVHRDRLVKFNADWNYGIPEVNVNNVWVDRFNE